MKKTLLLAAAALASTVSSQAAITFNNGNFEDTSGTFPNGWTALGTAGNVTSVTSAPNLIAGSSTASMVANGGITQDFAASDFDGLTVFQVDMAFRLDSIAAAGAGSERIRIRDNGNSGDLITLRLNSAGVDRFSSTFGQALAYTLNSDTTYFLRLNVNGIGSGGSYTVALSSDGVNYTTSSANTGFHGTFGAVGAGANFETLTLENGGGGGFFVDNVVITPVPEPSVALLSGLGLLGLLRRRRR